MKKLTWATAVTVVPLAFLFLAVVGEAATFRGEAFQNKNEGRAIFGGPGSIPVAGEASALLIAAHPLASADASLEEPSAGSVEVAAASLAIPFTSGGNLTTRDGLTVYRAVRGETLSKVAANFGISLNTVLWANPVLRGKSLKAGDEIVILPVSGVLHRAEDGETVTGIAALYGIPVAEVLAQNPTLSDEPLGFGEPVVVPGANPRRVSGPDANLPNIPGYFAPPAPGWNWGAIHPKNAVDISNACGTPVATAAEGLVVRAESSDEWYGGYGKNVEIEHPNGTATRYGHLSKVSVQVGAYVERGEKIGEIGNTGNVTGITGCHLHFEVRGARNPLAR